MGIETGAAIIGGSLISGLINRNASNNAAQAQENAANTASNTEMAQFNQNREDMAPWRTAGAGALSQLVSGTQPGGEYMRDFGAADFQADPGYQFRQTEGRRMLEGSAAGRGGLLSGSTLKALEKYSQGVASDEYGNAYNRYNANLDRRYNRLSSLAGTGQTATRDVAQMGSNTAANVAQNQLSIGNSRASGYVGGANAVGGALNGIGNYAMLSQLTQPRQTIPNSPWAGGGLGYYDSADTP